MPVTQDALIVTIEHEYGSNVYVVKDQQQADDLLHRYADRWWESVLDEERRPRKKKALVSRYFEATQNDSYTVEHVHTDAQPGDEVWGLMISHEYGSDGTIHRTEDAAREHLFGFVQEWWEREVDSDVAGTIPTCRDEAINVYFEVVDDESYALDKAIFGQAQID